MVLDAHKYTLLDETEHFYALPSFMSPNVSYAHWTFLLGFALLLSRKY